VVHRAGQKGVLLHNHKQYRTQRNIENHGLARSNSELAQDVLFHQRVFGQKKKTWSGPRTPWNLGGHPT
jgi:hypothetical protein